MQRHLLATLLLCVARWHRDADRGGGRDAGDDPDMQLYGRFVGVLERDFARHHGIAHYAEALAMPHAALAAALARATGLTTKELITDRVMLEAARLLRFGDLTVGEVAHRTGFADPLYFSRAFKRCRGESPLAYRARLRGVREKSMNRPGRAIPLRPGMAESPAA